MKRPFIALFALVAVLASALVTEAAELRVFIRGGAKSHGPGAHEHERFLGDWTKLLTERGMKVSGGMEFPTEAELDKTDLLVMYSQEGGEIPADKRAGLEKFLKRGGGITVIHTASVPKTKEGADYLKSIIGGTWVPGTTKWLEGPMSLYYVNRTHAITTGVANYDMNDEIYYDMDISPDVTILAGAYTPNVSAARKNDQRGQPGKGKITVYDIQPQMWTYEKTLSGGQPYRSFVHIPGHMYTNFSQPHFRAVLLRGMAWSAKRSNVDEFCTKEELASLRYPAGGPQRPDKALEQLVIHPDFKVKLVASEPLINKVMNVDWDPQGRLWVAETPEYPDGRFANDTQDLVQRWVDGKADPATGRYDRKAFDKISMLTDTDGDGVMDKKTIFYEGLELVTSFVFHKDGVIVAQAPDILWLRDTNGDGKADKVETLYTGLGTRDTHAVLNNIRWGFDGWIYGTHGYSASQKVTNGDGSKNFGTIGSGVIRFKPDGSAIEQYSSKGGNTWGLQVAWDNEVFYTQPTSGDLLMNVVLPEANLSKGRMPGVNSFSVVRKTHATHPAIPYDQLPYVQIDFVGQFTAAAGCVIYGGGSWPEAYNYNYFTTEPTINIVHHETVSPSGVSFTAARVPDRENVEFIAGKDYWFRPIEVRTGPDGAVYMVDFYNQAAIHNDTRGPKHGPRNAAIRPDRDHYYGRIWRIDHKDAKKLTIPKLSAKDTDGLITALRHPNDNVRLNAVRLLVETGDAKLANKLTPLMDAKENAATRVAALWTLQRIGGLSEATLVAAVKSDSLPVKKNGLKVAQLPPTSQRGPETQLHQALNQMLLDANPQVQLQALIALGSFEVDDDVAAALIAVYPKLTDGYLQSAALGVANSAPRKMIETALASANPTPLRPLVMSLTQKLADKQDAEEAANLVIAMAGKPATADPLKQAILEGLVQNLNATTRPEWSVALQAAVEKLLKSPNDDLAIAALPLTVRWDTGRKLDDTVNPLLQEMIGSLSKADKSDDERLKTAKALLAVRHVNESIVTGVSAVLGSNASENLQRSILEAFGDLQGAKIGTLLVETYPKLNAGLQSVAFTQITKRGPWTESFLDAMKAKKIELASISPANIHRLRTHANREVSEKANKVLDDLRGPEAKEKDAIIAKLTPAVEKPGDVTKGKELFMQNCANCHKLGNDGKDVGPVLTGMGAHGPGELLVHIIDPNRALEHNYAAINFETKDGESYDGIIAQENNQSVIIKNAAGEMEIKKSNIKSRRNTGMSLMPNGFEALGEESLRDLLAFMCAGDQKYRFLDLSKVYTADSRRGLYIKEENVNDTLKFTKFGNVNVEGVPFYIADPAKYGRNLLQLKGGGNDTYSFTMPQKVEVKMGYAAGRLHFLGGVAGWGHPYTPGANALKVTVHYADGQKEELVAKNGDQFADFIRVVEVPGSRLTQGLVKENQLRWYTHSLKRSNVVIEKVTIESFANGLAPTTVAITAELPGADGKMEPMKVASLAPVAPPAPAKPFEWGKGTKVLLVGGGSSHDYNRFFNFADIAILKTAGMTANYTEDPAVTAKELPNVDVAVFSVNRNGFQTPELRAALNKHIAAGKGLVLLHPGVWYNWGDWPEYNKTIAGGGSRGHDKLGEFEVKVTNAAHPIMKDVPATFLITDELYYFIPDTAGTPIEVLATADSKIKNATFPQVFVVKHPQTKIAAITLGHDARAHDLQAYKTLLINAVNWTKK
ncbi:MAG TPA: PVC-type heme-binding CxxCH protein [Verrucomicrobiae bacterium]